MFPPTARIGPSAYRIALYEPWLQDRTRPVSQAQYTSLTLHNTTEHFGPIHLQRGWCQNTVSRGRPLLDGQLVTLGASKKSGGMKLLAVSAFMLLEVPYGDDGNVSCATMTFIFCDGEGEKVTWTLVPFYIVTLPFFPFTRSFHVHALLSCMNIEW